MVGSEMRSPERSRPRAATPKSAPAPVPTLNKFARSRVAKGESGNYLELLKAMQDAAKGGGSAAKSTLPKVFPGLCKFSELPSAAVPILLAVTKLPDKKDDALRKLQRCAYYLLHVALSMGVAGTPQPYSSSQTETARTSAPLGLAAPAWKEATGQVTNPARQRLALRLLAATARASAEDSTPDGEGSAIAELTRVLDQLFLALAGASAGKRTASRSGLFGGKGAAGAGEAKEKSLSGEGAAAMRSALAAVRVGAAPYPSAMSDLCVAGFDGLLSSDGVGVRHALALAATAAAADPILAVERTGALLQETLNRFGAHGTLYLPPTMQQAKPAKRGAKATAGVLLLDDPFARLYLARLAAAVAHSDHFSSPPARQQAEPFWHALVLLATRDPSDLVVMEAIRQMAGGACRASPLSPPPAPSSSCPTPPPLAKRSSAAFDAKGLPAFSPTAKAMEKSARVSEAQGREGRTLGARAWMMILKETLRSTLPPSVSSPRKAASPPAAPGERADKPSETLISYIVARLRAGLKSRHPPLVCSAARTAAALCEARALAVEVHGLAAQGESFVVKAMELLLRDLQTVLEGRADASQGCCAMLAVVWMQLPGRSSLMSPAAMHRHAASGGPAPGAPEPWPPSLIQRLLRCLLARLQTSHALAPWVLRCTAAVAAASPSGTDPEQLTLLWGAALQCGPSASSAALHAAFELLDSPPAPAAASRAAEAAAWSRLQRVAAWWLGANANLAAGEVAWEGAKVASAAGNSSGLQLLVDASQRSPVMGTVISQLQSAMLTGAWQVRVAAAQALGKVAIRSAEPYRLQCYAILRGATAVDGSEGDPMGLTSTVMPILRILDACYSSACVLQQCIGQWGNNPEEWPARHLTSLRARHRQLLADICAKVCYVPPSLFLPMGPASAPLIQPSTDAPAANPYGRSMSGSELEGLMAAGSVPGSVLSGLEGSGLEELLDEAPSTPPHAGDSEAGETGRRRSSDSSEGGSWAEGGGGGSGGGSEVMGEVEVETDSEGSSPEMMPTLSEGVSIAELQANAAALRAADGLEGSEEAGEEDGAGSALALAGVGTAAALVAARAMGRQGSVDADAFEFDSPSASQQAIIGGGDATEGGAPLRVADLDGEFALGSLFGSAPGVGGVSVGEEGAADGVMDSSHEETDLSFNDLAAESQPGDASLDAVEEKENAVETDKAAAQVPYTTNVGDGLHDALASFDSEAPLSSVNASVISVDEGVDDGGLVSVDSAATHSTGEVDAFIDSAPLSSSNSQLDEAGAEGGGDGVFPVAQSSIVDRNDGAAATVNGFASFDLTPPFPAAAQSSEIHGSAAAAVFDPSPLSSTVAQSTFVSGGDGGVVDSLASFDSAPLPSTAPFASDASGADDPFASSFDSAPLPATEHGATTKAGSASSPFVASPVSTPGGTAVSDGAFAAFDSAPLPLTTFNDDGGGGLTDAPFPAFESTPFPSVTPDNDPFIVKTTSDDGFAAFGDSATAAVGGFSAFSDEPLTMGSGGSSMTGDFTTAAHLDVSPSQFPSSNDGFAAFGDATAVPLDVSSSNPPASNDGFDSSWANFSNGGAQISGGDGFGDFATMQPPTSSDVVDDGSSVGRTAAVVYSFTAEEAGEVSVCAGQQVLLVEGGEKNGTTGDGWSAIRLEDGSAGVVPTNYLILGGNDGGGSGVSQQQLEAVAEYDFTGEAAGELSVRAGDQLAVRSEVDGWYEVCRARDGAAGLVPVSYVRPASTPSHAPRPP